MKGARLTGVALLALFAFAGLALSVLDGWRPAGGNGVGWIELILRDDPRTRVEDYLAALRSGDTERALFLWSASGRAGPDAALLEDRRATVTAALVRADLGRHRVVDVQWWGTCCEPHPVDGAAFAQAARVTIGSGDPRSGYVFDVLAAPPGRSLLDEVARRWEIVDVYPAGDEPLALRWVNTGSGSVGLGPALPRGSADCGRSEETPARSYDPSARECVWSRYSAGTPVVWTQVSHTLEGAPVRTVLRAQNGFVVMTMDRTADGFSAAADRRLWAWQCRDMTKVPWPTDRSRYSLELSGCLGDGTRTAIP